MKQGTQSNRKRPVPTKVAPPKYRRFRVRIEREVEIGISEDVLRATASQEWIESIGDFGKDPLRVAEHLAHNLVTNDLRLQQIDGYADQPDDAARVVDDSWPDYEAEEIPSSKKGSRR